MTKEILTTAAAAKLLGVSVRTAQLWLESGRLPSWKTPGGHRRVRRSDVVALLAGAGRGSAVAREIEEEEAPDLIELPEYSFPVPPNEYQRAKSVERTGLLDTPPERGFDSLTWIASEFLQMPFALLTLLSCDRQFFKSRQGLDMTETPRDWAFCNYTILASDVLIIPDLKRDKRFAKNPAVANEPHFRFYAGAPVIDHGGFALG
jgi:excisionase family DNA binding protein